MIPPPVQTSLARITMNQRGLTAEVIHHTVCAACSFTAGRRRRAAGLAAHSCHIPHVNEMMNCSTDLQVTSSTLISRNVKTCSGRRAANRPREPPRKGLRKQATNMIDRDPVTTLSYIRLYRNNQPVGGVRRHILQLSESLVLFPSSFPRHRFTLSTYQGTAATRPSPTPWVGK